MPMPGTTNKRAAPISTGARRSKRRRTKGFIQRRKQALTIDELPTELIVYIAQQCTDLASVLRWSLCSHHLFDVLVANGLDRRVRERLIGCDDCPCLSVAPRLNEESRTTCRACVSADCVEARNHRIAVAIRSERFFEGMSESYSSLRERALHRMMANSVGRYAFTEDMRGSVESSELNMDHLLDAVLGHGLEVLAPRAFALHLRFQDMRRAVDQRNDPTPKLPQRAWRYLPWAACQAEEDFIYHYQPGWLLRVFPKLDSPTTDAQRVDRMLDMVRRFRDTIATRHTFEGSLTMPACHDDRHCAFNDVAQPACRSTDSTAIHVRYQARVMRDVLHRVVARLADGTTSNDLIHILAIDGAWTQEEMNIFLKGRLTIRPAWTLVTDPAMCEVDFVDDFNLLDALWPTSQLSPKGERSLAFQLTSACLSDSDALFQCGEQSKTLVDHRSLEDTAAIAEGLLEICVAPTNANIRLMEKLQFVTERSGLVDHFGGVAAAVMHSIFRYGHADSLLLIQEHWLALHDRHWLAAKLVPEHRALSSVSGGFTALCVNATSFLIALLRLARPNTAAKADLSGCLASAEKNIESLQEPARSMALLPLVALARVGALDASTNTHNTQATLGVLEAVELWGAEELRTMVM